MKTAVASLIGFVAMTVAFILLGMWLWPVTLHHLWVFVRLAWPFLASLIIAVVLFIVPSTLSRITGVLVVLAGLSTAFIGPWVIAQANYKAISYEDKTYSELSYANRAPYDVANRISSSFLGDERGHGTGIMKAIPARSDAGRYSTSLITPGVAKGYDAVQVIDLPLYGTPGNGNVMFCHYDKDKAKLRLGGWALWNSLDKKIARTTSPSTTWERDDAVATCEGAKNDNPMLYVPLMKRTNAAFFPQRVFGGVAVYNGSTGELKIYDDLKTDLPLYPKSLAEAARNSTGVKNGYWPWLFHMSSNGGYDDTSKDANDPNNPNISEFGLASEDHKSSFYITPLTARGSSTSISAIGQVESSGEMKSGEYRDFKIFPAKANEARSANSNIASSIQSMLAEKATNMHVMEIVPAQNGNWAASIGNDQSVKYRAIINKDESIDVYDKDGNVIVTTRSGVKGSPVSGDSGDNGSTGSNDDTVTIPTNGRKLSDMSNDELKKIANQITDELIKRADSGEAKKAIAQDEAKK